MSKDVLSQAEVESLLSAMDGRESDVIADAALPLSRSASAASTSGGTETFSTTKLVVSIPYLAAVTGLISGRSASPNRPSASSVRIDRMATVPAPTSSMERAAPGDRAPPCASGRR